MKQFQIMDLPEKTDCETEETYVDYQVTNVQGTGYQKQASCSTADLSVDGAYSFVARSLKLSTV